MWVGVFRSECGCIGVFGCGVCGCDIYQKTELPFAWCAVCMGTVAKQYGLEITPSAVSRLYSTHHKIKHSVLRTSEILTPED